MSLHTLDADTPVPNQTCQDVPDRGPINHRTAKTLHGLPDVAARQRTINVFKNGDDLCGERSAGQTWLSLFEPLQFLL